MKNNRGFTLVELLVSISLLAILTVIAIPTLRAFQANNDKKTYENYGKSMVASAKLYNDSYSDDLFGNLDNGCQKVTLTEMIKVCKNSDFLGEVALVAYDSPISNTKMVFEETLFDENAACHIALGDSFPECIKDGNKKSREELYKLDISDIPNKINSYHDTLTLLSLLFKDYYEILFIWVYDNDYGRDIRTNIIYQNKSIESISDIYKLLLKIYNNEIDINEIMIFPKEGDDLLQTEECSLNEL